jgi:hypothetical protein
MTTAVGVPKTVQAIEKVVAGPTGSPKQVENISKLVQNTTKPSFKVLERGSETNTRAFFNTLGGFWYSFAPLLTACAVSHLYPTPLHVVVGGIATTSDEARLMVRMPRFNSRFWIRVSEKTSSRQLDE